MNINHFHLDTHQPSHRSRRGNAVFKSTHYQESWKLSCDTRCSSNIARTRVNLLRYAARSGFHTDFKQSSQ